MVAGSYGARRVGDACDVPVTVETVKVGDRRAAYISRLTNEDRPVRVPRLDASDDLLQHLQVARWVDLVDEVAGGHACDRLGDAVAVAIVDDCDRIAILREEAVLEVVSKCVAIAAGRISVGVV